MNDQVQITYRNVAASDAIERLVHERVEKLNRFSSRITSIRVVIEEPHRRHKSGNAYLVKVDLNVAGAELVASHESNPDDGENLASCVRDAFGALERELRTHADRQREGRRSEPDPTRPV